MKTKILIILIIMGLCYDIALIFSFEKIYPENMEINFLCEIVKEKEEKDYYNKYIVKVIQCKSLEKCENTKLILYVSKDKNFIPGDILIIKGKFEKGEVSRNYKGFNYRNYLKQNKIYGIVFGKEVKHISLKKDYNYFLFKIRNTFENRIDKLYQSDYASFLKGLLIGDKSQLNDEIVENFKDANISHILAISGLHISFILVGLNFILEKIINSKKIRNWIIIFLLCFFLILTGNSASCMRACIMSIFTILCSLFYKKNNIYISFIVSFVFIIILNPYNILNIGMWLSYFGTIGIIITYDFLYKIIYKKFYKNKLVKKNKNIENMKSIYYFNEKMNNVKLFTLKSLSLSISVQIFIVPIIIYVFNNFSFTFFISNIITSFFIGYILAIGYISIFISFIFFPISNFILGIEKTMIFIIFYIAKNVSQMPLSKIYVTTPSVIFIIFYYIILISFIIYFKFNKMHILRILLCPNYLKRYRNPKELFMFNIKSKIIFQAKYIINIIVILMVISIFININKFYLQIYFIDVGQGDCTFIITPYGKRILIDGGEGKSDKYNYGENVVFPYLLDRGINRIDYVIASHADSDHIGGLIYILENMKVKNILIGIQPESSNQLEKLIEIANSKKIKIQILEKGDIKTIDKNVELEVLWPDKNNLISENTLNNNSLVFKLKYDNFCMLFTGDIEENAEKSILQEYTQNPEILRANILKVAHHGSKSSSTQEFLNTVCPQIALIGVGKNNKFGHPSEEVITRYQNLNTKIYRTDLNGEICIQVNRRGKYKVNCYLYN